MSFPQQAFTSSSAFSLSRSTSTSSPSWLAKGEKAEEDVNVHVNRNEYDRLCNKCAKLNLEESFVNAFALYEGARRGTIKRKVEVYRSEKGPAYLADFYFVTSLGNRLSSIITLCKLCNFFKQTCPNPGKGTYKLLAICTSESYMFEIPKKAYRRLPDKRPWGEIEHNVFMTLVPEVALIPKTGVPLRWIETELPKYGPIYRLTQMTPEERLRLAAPRLVGPRVDISLGREWLNSCRECHKFCAPKKLAGASLPGLRVINCRRSPLAVEDRPWSARYVALSYVWGQTFGDWPKTVLDAAEVTKQPGEQYLWVDRLCIDQSNLQEKQFLISKMDAIYEGAEFTIVAAAGDASTGLPGVTTKYQKVQPLVKLKKRIRITSAELANDPANPTPGPSVNLLGITREEYEETLKDREWLDLHRFGVKSKMALDSEDIRWFKKEQEILKICGISQEHLRIFQDFADDHGYSIDEWMQKMNQQAQNDGIPLQELAPHILREIATRVGMPAEAIANITRRPTPPITCDSKIEKPLPLDLSPGTTILVSTLEDPRISVRRSKWATRSWTYQEGVLSNRRLVFLEQQMYWECNGMAMNESLDILDLCDPSKTRFADYMLSGIFDGDLHRVPQLQYGFKKSDVDEVSEQVLKLDGHVRVFTVRDLSYDNDSLNAFLGIAARYSTTNGLCLLLGMPIWAGLFATGKPGLQDTFALSISAWTHTTPRVAKDAEMYVMYCPRRPQFPSWTWIGWKGRADFSATTTIAGEDKVKDAIAHWEWADKEDMAYWADKDEDNAAGWEDQDEDDAAGWEDADEDDATGWEDAVHVEFFKAMTSNSWAGDITRLWSAEMMLHATDGSEATWLVGHAPVPSTATNDLSKTWLLTIREPLVLRHMFLMPSNIEGEWKRLMGKRVQLHLSVHITEAELIDGHKSGEMVTVLVFASTVPFVFNGTARSLILRRADDAGTRWERIRRLAMALEESELDEYKSTAGMITALPVEKFGRDIVLI
jgi:Heterokaryon incompatibility protein (HET)